MRLAVMLVAVMAADGAAAHYMSGCRTSNLGGGTCQKHSHSHRNTGSTGYNTNKTPAMGIDGDEDTQARRVKPPAEPLEVEEVLPRRQPCSLLQLIFIGCPQGY